MIEFIDTGYCHAEICGESAEILDLRDESRGWVLTTQGEEIDGFASASQAYYSFAYDFRYGAILRAAERWQACPIIKLSARKLDAWALFFCQGAISAVEGFTAPCSPHADWLLGYLAASRWGDECAR